MSLDLTVRLEPLAEQLDEAFREGVQDGLNGRRSANLRQAQGLWDDVREDYGLARCHPTLLTAPRGNVKLAKSRVPAWGLTLQQHVQRITERLVVNVCPHAGDCVAVCVMNEGNGRYDKVQVSRRARTAFLTLQPRAFSYLLGYELGRVERDNIAWLFRPNVGSDVAWERLLPSMLDGSALPNMVAYGYSKRPEVLATDGWISTQYRVAYSWNEDSDDLAVCDFLARGGSVAVVTDRTRRQPAAEFVTLSNSETTSLIWPFVRDADKTDEWIFERGVIGDLSAKGKARKLIGESGFVVTREAA